MRRASVGTNLPTWLACPLKHERLVPEFPRTLIEIARALVWGRVTEVYDGAFTGKRLRSTPAGGAAVIRQINDAAPPLVCD
ncbi:hypothetical protein [Dermabacter hominis]|uniref:hypothetical protein n=1 Tax=Dermabacter hominis TaxID=36740 RepID=UPI0021A6AEB9|nr:hypothetical protein [Dermabacter hominis]MCT1716622.1 hypothetical protein [Dermabacter hominis]